MEILGEENDTLESSHRTPCCLLRQEIRRQRTVPCLHLFFFLCYGIIIQISIRTGGTGMNRKEYHIVLDTSVKNPALTKWKKYESRFRHALRQDPESTVVIHNTSGRSVMETCRKITARGRSGNGEEEITLLIIGGDGTLNEAINGICDFDRVKIGYLPAGSANDFARSLGILHKDKETIKAILDNKVRRVLDLGQVSYQDDGEVKRRFFNVSAGFGYDAAVCAEVDRSCVKKILNRLRLGKLVYLFMAVKLLFTAPVVSMKILLTGEEEGEIKSICTKRGFFAVCMNHAYEGGGFRFCPEADPEDGILDLCLASDIFRPSFFRIFPSVYGGNHEKFSCFTIGKGREIRMTSALPMWLHVDGEAIGKTRRVVMRLHARKLKFIM